MNPLLPEIQKDADQCVKCGLCLPHCPTYALTQNECESPRGRIALMAGWASGDLPSNEKLQTYLGHCLTCRACETVCPAKVPYGRLIDNTRAALRPKKLPFGLNLIIKYSGLLRLASYLLYIYQRLGLQQLIRKLKLLETFNLKQLARYDALLSIRVKPQAYQSFYEAITKERGRVALFTGCINSLVDQTTIAAAIKVLTSCGYAVYVPSAQACCGAMHLHAGFSEQSQTLANKNIAAFKSLKIDAIITLASGCGATLKEYVLQNNNHDTARFSNKIMDISQFLTEIEWPISVKLKPLSQRVALHTPCTLRNILQQAAAPANLLQKIPDIQLTLFTSKTFCCGAAGLYMLQYSEMADNLLEQVLEEFTQIKADWVVTTNIGCQLHIAKTLKNKGFSANVVHPITLLASQLSFIGDD